MLGSGRNNCRVSIAHVVFFTVNYNLARPQFKPEKLVGVRMRLRSDLLIRLQAHHYHLGVFAGIHNLTEIPIGHRYLFYASRVSRHFLFASLCVNR